MTKKKPEGRKICKCECGGQVRGIESLGRLFTWCEKCTPVVEVKASDFTKHSVRQGIEGIRTRPTRQGGSREAE